ncbi:MAG: hypothetical protein AABW89_00170 [Nanoarchaeota archaeon]
MSKHAFWQALIFTVIIFSLGLILGFFLESKQSDRIYSDLRESELNILDEQLRQKLISDSNLSCSISKESLFLFADKIYQEALILENLDGTGRLSNLNSIHRRYDLLRTLLFLEAGNLKSRCSDNFKIITYFYYYNSEDIGISSKQNYFSRQVYDLKIKYPEEIILIPLAIDTGLASVDLFLKSLYIESYPAIVIDDLYVVTDNLTLKELENLVFNNSSVYSP